MTGDDHIRHCRIAAPALASALAPLCHLPAAGTRVRVVPTTVAPAAVEIIAVAALVLLHHLPVLLVAASPEVPIHG